MKKTPLPTALAIACLLVMGLAGCGNGPAAGVVGYLNSARNADKPGVASYCYDKNSIQTLEDRLRGQVFGTSVKVISVTGDKNQSVRRKGYTAREIASVEARMAGPLGEIESRFKPLIDQANAVLSNAQWEYENAVAQKKYAAITYGPNMPQYYAEQVRINNALPRLRNAQSRVDQLNAAKAAEIAALKAGAEAGYAQDKAASDKALSSNSITLPTFEVNVEMVQGGSSQRRVFTLVRDGQWKVYSVNALK
jgi:hypothetical protein